ncbi:hypothetical protein VFPFJ_05017 [Purpureocillium lilacinum]|uniref:Uncharacterized protein n=1 Tax=Purpureocillium lilacinum TaxID=33203 RepID=A0A179HMG3_PURLI|nr:hypothetical protein VFPFJ_05017 [Purpureocillium lilacinum]OAQ90858.1 hypothetical protein VFPFJ_05017 [Purpureocillium lilacinum]
MGERHRQSYKFPGVGFARDGRRAVGLDDKGRHGQTREGKKEKIKARWRFAKLERIRPTVLPARQSRPIAVGTPPRARGRNLVL